MKQTIKARVIATNEVVRVYQAKEGDIHFIDENNNPYKCEELDFTVEEEPKDPIERLERMMGMLNKPTPFPKFPTQDEINESNLKLEKEKFKLKKEEMRLQFMCDFILKAGSDYRSCDEAGADAAHITKIIFGDNEK